MAYLNFVKLLNSPIPRHVQMFCKYGTSPGQKKVIPIPVDELGSRRRELTKPSRTAHILFDPRPLFLRQESSLSLENCVAIY